MNYSRRHLYALGEPLGDSATRAKPCGRMLCGGGGDSSSSSSQATTTTNLDKRQVVDNGALGVSSDSSTVNVTVLDNGAIAQAIDLSKTSVTANQQSFSDLIDMSKTGTAQAYTGLDHLLGFANDVLTLEANSQKLISQSASNVGDAYKTAQDMSSGNRMLVAGGLILAGIVALNAMKKG